MHSPLTKHCKLIAYLLTCRQSIMLLIIGYVVNISADLNFKRNDRKKIMYIIMIYKVLIAYISQ